VRAVSVEIIDAGVVARDRSRETAEHLRQCRLLTGRDHIVLRQHAAAGLARSTLVGSELAPDPRVDHGHRHALTGDAAELQRLRRHLARVVGLWQAAARRARGDGRIHVDLQGGHLCVAQRLHLFGRELRGDRADDGQIAGHPAAGAHHGAARLAGAPRLHDVGLPLWRRGRARRLRRGPRGRLCGGDRRRHRCAYGRHRGRSRRLGAHADHQRQQQHEGARRQQPTCG